MHQGGETLAEKCMPDSNMFAGALMVGDMGMFSSAWHWDWNILPTRVRRMLTSWRKSNPSTSDEV